MSHAVKIPRTAARVPEPTAMPAVRILLAEIDHQALIEPESAERLARRADRIPAGPGRSSAAPATQSLHRCGCSAGSPSVVAATA